VLWVVGGLHGDLGLNHQHVIRPQETRASWKLISDQLKQIPAQSQMSVSYSKQYNRSVLIPVVYSVRLH